MPHGWRARTHHLSRNRAFLIRTSLIIVVAGFALGCLVQWFRVGVGAAESSGVSLDPVVRRQQEDARTLEQASQPQTRLLTHWLRWFFLHQVRLTEKLDRELPDIAAFMENGELFGFKAARLIEKHTRPGEERQLFTDYVVANLGEEEDKGKAAMERVRQVTEQDAAMPCANEMLGFLELAQGRTAEALAAFLREGKFDDADDSRAAALRLAVDLRQTELLRELASDPRWLAAATPALRARIGALTGDVWLQWRSIAESQLKHTRWGLLLLTLFASGLWYVIFVQRAESSRWRWSWPLLAVIAGVGSIWPTVMILQYQEMHLGMSGDAPFPHDLWYYLAGVGLREEASKLALFSLFMPWLLWRGSASNALLAGACVGLGFALEENVGYYAGGGATAWARFVTANFMHAAMTAIAGHALYEMLRTRFGHAEKFVVTFLAIVLAHGLYDFTIVSDHALGNLIGINILHLIILALLATRFFELVAETSRPNPGPLAPAAVFLIGSALLIAVLFIVAGFTTQELSGITAVGIECAGLAPVMFVFWRKFETR